VEIIIEDGKVTNLAELMEGSEWWDSPNPDGPFLCLSSRTAFGTIGGVEHGVAELHRCNTRPTRVIVKNLKSDERVLDYETHLPYRRDPHKGETLEQD